METVSWDEFKIILAKNPAALPYYLDRGDYYTVYTNHGGLIIGVGKLFKEDAAEFEANYKSKCDSPEPQRIRVRTSREDYFLHSRFFSWDLSTTTPNNNDHHGNDFGDITIRLFSSYANVTANDHAGIEETNPSLATITVLDFMPTYSYAIENGEIYLPNTFSGGGAEYELHVVALPDTPLPAGVTPVKDHPLVANPRLDLRPGATLTLDASMNHAQMDYTPYNTNKIRFLIKHPAGANETFQVRMNMYRGGLW